MRRYNTLLPSWAGNFGGIGRNRNRKRNGGVSYENLYYRKKHIWRLAYKPKECIKELTDTCIVSWKDGEVHSLTAIRVNKNGKVSYGRTVKY